MLFENITKHGQSILLSCPLPTNYPNKAVHDTIALAITTATALCASTKKIQPLIDLCIKTDKAHAVPVLPFKKECEDAMRALDGVADMLGVQVLRAIYILLITIIYNFTKKSLSSRSQLQQ